MVRKISHTVLNFRKYFAQSFNILRNHSYTHFTKWWKCKTWWLSRTHLRGILYTERKQRNYSFFKYEEVMLCSKTMIAAFIHTKWAGIDSAHWFFTKNDWWTSSSIGRIWIALNEAIQINLKWHRRIWGREEHVSLFFVKNIFGQVIHNSHVIWLYF